MGTPARPPWCVARGRRVKTAPRSAPHALISTPKRWQRGRSGRMGTMRRWAQSRLTPPSGRRKKRRGSSHVAGIHCYREMTASTRCKQRGLTRPDLRCIAAFSGMASVACRIWQAISAPKYSSSHTRSATSPSIEPRCAPRKARSTGSERSTAPASLLMPKGWPRTCQTHTAGVVRSFPQEGPGLLQVGRIVPFGEPAVDRRHQLAGLRALALPVP